MNEENKTNDPAQLLARMIRSAFDAARACAVLNPAEFADFQKAALAGLQSVGAIARAFTMPPNVADVLRQRASVDEELMRERFAEIGASILLLSVTPEPHRAAALRALQGHDAELLKDFQGTARSLVVMQRAIMANAIATDNARAFDGAQELETIG
jgi:hypothetical protein